MSLPRSHFVFGALAFIAERSSSTPDSFTQADNATATFTHADNATATVTQADNAKTTVMQAASAITKLA